MTVAASASGMVVLGMTLVCCQYVTKESSSLETNAVSLNNFSLKLKFQRKIVSHDVLVVVVDKSADWLHTS